jgi:tetratricopeptide (TPR) repeat protein
MPQLAAMILRGEVMAIDRGNGSGAAKVDTVYHKQIGGAIRCINRHDLDGATDACSAGLKHNPGGCEAYFLFSVVAFLLKDLGRAIEFANKGHELDPDCAEGCDILAHIQAYAGNMGDSVYFAKLSAAGESNPLLADLQVDGLDDLAKALDGAGESVSYQVDALRAFYEEDFDTAIATCEKELRLHQGNQALFLLYGRSLLGQGLISRGIAALHGALHLDPDKVHLEYGPDFRPDRLQTQMHPVPECPWHE